MCGAIALVVTQLSKQRTERIKHFQSVELERERLWLTLAAFERGVAKGQSVDLADLTQALRGDGCSARDSPDDADSIGPGPPMMSPPAYQ